MRRLGMQLLSLPLTVLGAVTITFLILHLTPGDPAEIILGDYATPAQVAALRSRLGLDEPLPAQYLSYILSVGRADFGRSLTSGEPVFREMQNVLPYTVQLAVASTLVAVAVGVPLGVAAAVRRNSLVDYVTMLVALIGISAPIFVLGFVMLLVFAYLLPLFPLIGAGRSDDLMDQLYHLVLPAVTLGLTVAALFARATRSSLLDVLGSEYLRTARAKGLSAGTVLWRHAFRNALIPVVTIVAMQLGTLLGGAVVTEVVFSRQGLGKLLVDSILSRDYPRVQGIVALFAFMVVAVNLAAESLYSMLDPRIE